jgi:hypothetical protein
MNGVPLDSEAGDGSVVSSSSHASFTAGELVVCDAGIVRLVNQDTGDRCCEKAAVDHRARAPIVDVHSKTAAVRCKPVDDDFGKERPWGASRGGRDVVAGPTLIIDAG